METPIVGCSMDRDTSATAFCTEERRKECSRSVLALEIELGMRAINEAILALPGDVVDLYCDGKTRLIPTSIVTTFPAVEISQAFGAVTQVCIPYRAIK